MKILELYAGSRSIGRQAELMGHTVFSVDWKAFEGIDLVTDIEFLKLSDIPFVPDMVWESPDCTTYTVAAIYHHRNGVEPKTDYAKKCDRVNMHVIGLILDWLAINPNLKYFIENPRGMMRKMPFMQHLDRATVTYCQYGDTRMKPTDIWSNNIHSMFNPNGTWHPKQPCKNGDTCHEPAPRGSRTGTQGKKGSYERSKIPTELCIEIINSVKL